MGFSPLGGIEVSRSSGGDHKNPKISLLETQVFSKDSSHKKFSYDRTGSYSDGRFHQVPCGPLNEGGSGSGTELGPTCLRGPHRTQNLRRVLLGLLYLPKVSVGWGLDLIFDSTRGL